MDLWTGLYDLIPMDYFLSGYVKSLVYADKPQILEHLEVNIYKLDFSIALHSSQLWRSYTRNHLETLMA